MISKSTFLRTLKDVLDFLYEDTVIGHWPLCQCFIKKISHLSLCFTVILPVWCSLNSLLWFTDNWKWISHLLDWWWYWQWHIVGWMGSWGIPRWQPGSQSCNGCEPVDSSLPPASRPDPAAAVTPLRYRHTAHRTRHRAGTSYTPRYTPRHLSHPNPVARTTPVTLKSRSRWRSRLMEPREQLGRQQSYSWNMYNLTGQIWCPGAKHFLHIPYGICLVRNKKYHFVDRYIVFQV